METHEINTYIPKGKMLLVYTADSISCAQYENTELYKDLLKSYPDFVKENPIYHHMTGKDFYDSVDCGGLIDYDGSIANVYIDGYESNLSLFHKGMTQGKFLVDAETWLWFCEEHEIIVNWANK